MSATRLDTRLVELGLAPSRSKARDYILRGLVSLDGSVCDQPSKGVTERSSVELKEGTPDFVSRGGEKLAFALNYFDINPSGLTAIDIGASTGGFTDVLLRSGAKLVYAVDVGRGQMDNQIASDRRVVMLEQTDARALDTTLIPHAPDLAVADVSFISLTKALPAVLNLMTPSASLVALVKPQFEAGRDAVGKGGIVRDELLRQAAVESVVLWVQSQAGWRVVGVVPSPIRGGSGNQEFLLGARRDG